MELLLFVLACYGCTQIVVYGSIFDKIRPSKQFLGGFFHCPMCVGYHVGVLLWCLSFHTGMMNFSRDLATAFLCGCISSGTSYALCMLFGDSGLNLFVEKNKDNN